MDAARRADAAPSSEADERLREVEALLAIATTVNATLDLPEALRRICRERANLLGADTAAAYLHDVALDSLVPVAGYHVPPDLVSTFLATPLPLREQGFYVPPWEDRRPILSDDVASDGRFSHELFRVFPHQSGLILPLVLDGDVAGAFYAVWWTARRALSAREPQMIATILDQVTVLLRTAARVRKAERERVRLEVMYDLARRLALVEDTEHLLPMLVEEAATLLGADAAGLRLLDGDALVVAARTPSAHALMRRPRLPIGTGFSGRVMSTGHSVAVGDLAIDTRFDAGDREAVLSAGFSGYLGVPLRLHERVIGVRQIFTRRRRQFTADDDALLAALAGQASVAIYKGRLLREAEDARRVVERLHRVAVSMRDSQGRDERLRAFARGVHFAVGFDRVSVFLVTPDGASLELAAAFGETESDRPPSLRLSPAAGALFQAIRSRKPVAVLDDGDLDRVMPLDSAYLHSPYMRARRFVVAPIIAGDRVIGIGVADNRYTRRQIPSAAIEPFALLCQQLATTLEEARIYAEAWAASAR